MEKDIPHKWQQQQAGVAIVVSDKIDWKTNSIKRDKEGHYIMIKGSIRQEDIKLVNIHVPNIEAPKYINQVLMDVKGETDSNRIIAGDLDTPLTSLDKSFRQKTNKETVALNNTLDYMDLTYIYRISYPKTAENRFFSSTHGTVSRIDPMLGHKTNLDNFKKTEIISSIFSDHNSMKLEINYKKKAGGVPGWLRR